MSAHATESLDVILGAALEAQQTHKANALVSATGRRGSLEEVSDPSGLETPHAPGLTPTYNSLGLGSSPGGASPPMSTVYATLFPNPRSASSSSPESSGSLPPSHTNRGGFHDHRETTVPGRMTGLQLLALWKLRKAGGTMLDSASPSTTVNSPLVAPIVASALPPEQHGEEEDDDDEAAHSFTAAPLRSVTVAPEDAITDDESANTRVTVTEWAEEERPEPELLRRASWCMNAPTPMKDAARAVELCEASTTVVAPPPQAPAVAHSEEAFDIALGAGTESSRPPTRTTELREEAQNAAQADVQRRVSHHIHTDANNTLANKVAPLESALSEDAWELAEVRPAQTACLGEGMLTRPPTRTTELREPEVAAAVPAVANGEKPENSTREPVAPYGMGHDSDDDTLAPMARSNRFWEASTSDRVTLEAARSIALDNASEHIDAVSMLCEGFTEAEDRPMTAHRTRPAQAALPRASDLTSASQSIAGRTMGELESLCAASQVLPQGVPVKVVRMGQPSRPMSAAAALSVTQSLMATLSMQPNLTAEGTAEHHDASNQPMAAALKRPAECLLSQAEHSVTTLLGKAISDDAPQEVPCVVVHEGRLHEVNMGTSQTSELLLERVSRIPRSSTVEIEEEALMPCRQQRARVHEAIVASRPATAEPVLRSAEMHEAATAEVPFAQRRRQASVRLASASTVAAPEEQLTVALREAEGEVLPPSRPVTAHMVRALDGSLARGSVAELAEKVAHLHSQEAPLLLTAVSPQEASMARAARIVRATSVALPHDDGISEVGGGKIAVWEELPVHDPRPRTAHLATSAEVPLSSSIGAAPEGAEPPTALRLTSDEQHEVEAFETARPSIARVRAEEHVLWSPADNKMSTFESSVRMQEAPLPSVASPESTKDEGEELESMCHCAQVMRPTSVHLTADEEQWHQHATVLCEDAALDFAAEQRPKTAHNITDTVAEHPLGNTAEDTLAELREDGPAETEAVPADEAEEQRIPTRLVKPTTHELPSSALSSRSQHMPVREAEVNDSLSHQARLFNPAQEPELHETVEPEVETEHRMARAARVQRSSSVHVGRSMSGYDDTREREEVIVAAEEDISSQHPVSRPVTAHAVTRSERLFSQNVDTTPMVRPATATLEERESLSTGEHELPQAMPTTQEQVAEGVLAATLPLELHPLINEMTALAAEETVATSRQEDAHLPHVATVQRSASIAVSLPTQQEAVEREAAIVEAEEDIPSQHPVSRPVTAHAVTRSERLFSQNVDTTPMVRPATATLEERESLSTGEHELPQAMPTTQEQVAEGVLAATLPLELHPLINEMTALAAEETVATSRQEDAHLPHVATVQRSASIAVSLPTQQEAVEREAAIVEAEEDIPSQHPVSRPVTAHAVTRSERLFSQNVDTTPMVRPATATMEERESLSTEEHELPQAMPTTQEQVAEGVLAAALPLELHPLINEMTALAAEETVAPAQQEDAHLPHVATVQRTASIAVSLPTQQEAIEREVALSEAATDVAASAVVQQGPLRVLSAAVPPDETEIVATEKFMEASSSFVRAEPVLTAEEVEEAHVTDAVAPRCFLVERRETVLLRTVSGKEREPHETLVAQLAEKSYGRPATAMLATAEETTLRSGVLVAIQDTQEPVSTVLQEEERITAAPVSPQSTWVETEPSITLAGTPPVVEATPHAQENENIFARSVTMENAPETTFHGHRPSSTGVPISVSLAEEEVVDEVVHEAAAPAPPLLAQEEEAPRPRSVPRPCPADLANPSIEAQLGERRTTVLPPLSTTGPHQEATAPTLFEPIVSEGLPGARPIHNPYRSRCLQRHTSSPNSTASLCVPLLARDEGLRTLEAVYARLCQPDMYKVPVNSGVLTRLRALSPVVASSRTEADPAGLAAVTSLSLANLCLKDAGVLPVLELARWCPNLAELDLSGNELTNEAVEWLAETVGDASGEGEEEEERRRQEASPAGKLLRALPLAADSVSNASLLSQQQQQDGEERESCPLHEGFAHPLRRLTTLRLSDNTLSMGALRLLKRVLRVLARVERVDARGMRLLPVHGKLPTVPPKVQL